MSSSYNNPWSTRSSRSNSERASSSEGQSYSSGGGYPEPSANYSSEPGDRPTSSSSLSGAMGDPNNARFSSPSGGYNDPMSWTNALQPPPINTMGLHPLSYSGVPNMPGLDAPYHDYPRASSGSSPPSSFTSPTYTDPFRNSSMYSAMSSAHPTSPPSSTYVASPQEEEIRSLRKRIRELERINAREHERVRALEAGGAAGSSRSPAVGRGSGCSPLAPPPVSASFQESWRLRTEARQRQFCSLNRAGNALCAWHDSRRERRVHPPRMAPPGYLNCGCTYAEALFEESLSRHGVGSYLPGENVRMDPALRNPLLKLLQERYGYRDGDFERDPRTGEWIPGEGHEFWEQQVQTSNPRRPRTDTERR
ncbi:hypothetical protein CPB85DRAFT_1253950 [Mucidula mucida]|nr:hypothetical protein CPB85DRAFT_1253950 [Mucidula mucida]